MALVALNLPELDDGILRIPDPVVINKGKAAYTNFWVENLIGL